MFGKGVYFAGKGNIGNVVPFSAGFQRFLIVVISSDVVTKAANYCHAKSRNPEGLLVLAEVALGRPFEATSANPRLLSPPSGFHSTKGLGKPREINYTFSFSSLKKWGSLLLSSSDISAN